jgi:hypothetical protein
MKCLWTLDGLLSNLSCLQGPKAFAMSMLYMHDRKFQKILTDFRRRDDQAPLADVLISLERKVIRLPDAEQEARCQDFLFDCHAAHKDTHDAEIAILTDQGTLHEVACSVAACIFACLRSHTRALMWKMCHEPSGVSDFFDSLDPQLWSMLLPRQLSSIKQIVEGIEFWRIALSEAMEETTQVQSQP